MKRIMINYLNKYIEEKVIVKGWVHKIRKLKEFSFVILRDRSGLVQCVISNDFLNNVKLETVVEIGGKVVEGKNKLNNFEIQVNNLRVLSEVNEDIPIEINGEELGINLDTMLNNRVLSLRHKRVNSIFKVENIIVDGFREFLNKEEFTEIYTPKIVSEGAEGGTEIFKVKYFENEAFLAQSPQFYKQMMVAAGFERVFEVGHVYRAEEHNTNRHLNEYVSLDFEMGFVEDENDIMDLEENLLKYVFNKLSYEGKEYIKLFECTIPNIENSIPRMKLSDAISILKSKYGRTDLEGDLDPEGEKQISKYVKEKYNSDFVFLTHYPRKKRPMYTMPLGEEETHSFDLIFRGMEITTGGLRIHDFNMLLKNFLYKGLNPKEYNSYINIFKYGVPPHGGLAIGLERITSQLLGLNNVREASLIPRDRTRLIP